MKKIVRNSAKAIIILDNQLLTLKHIDAEGEWHALPGGGQRHGETLDEALRRECKEEVGVDIIVGKLRFIREYRAWKHEFWETEGEQHQVEFMFDCAILPGQEPNIGLVPDVGQIDIAWLPIHETQKFRLYPKVLSEQLTTADDALLKYLGDVN